VARQKETADREQDERKEEQHEVVQPLQATNQIIKALG
jgi:hypothetical protein